MLNARLKNSYKTCRLKYEKYNLFGTMCSAKSRGIRLLSACSLTYHQGISYNPIQLFSYVPQYVQH